MPELPEVETVKRGLQPHMEGAVISQLDQNRADLRFPFPDQFIQRLAGAGIIGLRRRSKYLLADLDTSETLIMHLGMSGSFRVEGRNGANRIVAENAFTAARSRLSAHDHVVFHLSSGEQVIYNDPRRFGFMVMTATDQLDQHPLMAGLGVEPLGNHLNTTYLAERFVGKQAPLKAALLDQKIIAGLGNIYVCEALWRAKLSPRRAAGTLVRKSGVATPRLEALIIAIRRVIAEAIDAGGSSLRDHAKTDGSLGYFQNAHAVYDREGDPCQRLACSGVVQRIVQSNRSTFYCPTCQR